MKFLNGGWLVKDGYEVKYATHLYDYRVEPNRLTVYMPYSYVAHKGATLDGGLMTMEIFTPREEIIGVKIYNHKGQVKNTAV